MPAPAPWPRGHLPLALAALIALLPAPRAAAREAPPLPPAGTRLPSHPVRAEEIAVVRMSELARREAGRITEEGALTPLVILQGEEQLETETGEPETGTPVERHVFPAPGLAPMVASPAPAQSFMGLDDIVRLGTGTLVLPPDVDGAVGASHILEGLNNNYRAFNKSTGAIVSTVSILAFWAPAGGTGQFDPKTLYDPVQQRWIAVGLSDAGQAGSSLMIGVSQSSSPTGAWNLFRVRADTTGLNWADFPCVGYNKNWIAINVNLFNIATGAGTGSKCLIVDYAQARAGVFAATFVTGTGFCSSPVATYSATEPTLYVPTHLSSASGTYRVDTITGTPSAPVYTIGATRARGLTWVAASGAILPQAPPLSGSSACGATPCQIECVDAQIRSTPVLRSGSIWYTQTIGLPSNHLTHTAILWTRLDATTGNVLDGGRLEDPTASATNGGKWYAYGHVAVNAAGDAILSFTQCSSAQFAASGYAFRFAGDGAGTLRDPQIDKPGEDYYHKDYGSGRNRWGDYSKAQVDPTDDRSLWVVSEYPKARVGTDDGNSTSNSSKWSTWWARVGPSVTIGAGPSVAEGNSGSTPVGVPVMLSETMSTDVVVNYSVTDGTATTADGDYTSSGSSVTIPAGSISASIPLTVVGDPYFEPDETFQVTLTGATGALLGSPVTATVTILNDDPQPSLSIVRSASVAEGDTGVTTVPLAVSLSGPSGSAITVGFQTHDGTATVADGDYVPASGTLTFPAHSSAPQSASVGVKGDATREADETFRVTLGNPVGATIAVDTATVTIVNDDGVPALSIADASAPEGNAGTSTMAFVVSASRPSDQPIHAHVATEDGTATTADADYVALSGSFDLPAFAVTDTVRVTVNGDVRCEPDEQFRVVLSAIVGAAAADTEATGTIVNDDDCSTAVGDEPTADFALTGIAPNPAVGGTQVQYSMRREARVRLSIADLQGRTLAVLVDGVETAGRHAVRWNAVGSRGAPAAGVYFARFEAAGHVATRRFAVMR